MEESLFPSGSLIESVQDGRTSELERERICFRGKNFIFLGPSLGLSYESFIYIFFNNFHCELFDKLLFNWIIHKQVY